MVPCHDLTSSRPTPASSASQTISRQQESGTKRFATQRKSTPACHPKNRVKNIPVQKQKKWSDEQRHAVIKAAKRAFLFDRVALHPARNDPVFLYEPSNQIRAGCN